MVDSSEKATKKEILSKAINKIDQLVFDINESIFRENQVLPEGSKMEVDQLDFKPVYKRGQSGFEPVTTKEMHIEDD